MKIIARMESEFPTKFGIPRQSGIAAHLTGRIVFEPEYRKPEAVRGLEEFSHIWIIWGFSEAEREAWSPTVRPPRLGGNVRMGVFATRSPFRPNPIGLSSVRLLGVEKDPERGSVLRVAGADLMNGTPIYDIKPYLPYTDAHPDATGGFTAQNMDYRLPVTCPPEALSRIPEDKREALFEILAEDPRPKYHRDPTRVYGFPFAGTEIRFTASEEGITVVEIREPQTDTGGFPQEK